MTPKDAVILDVARWDARMTAAWLMGFSGFAEGSPEWEISGKLGQRMFKSAYRTGRPARVSVTLSRAEARWFVHHLPRTSDGLINTTIEGCAARVWLSAFRALRGRRGRPKATCHDYSPDDSPRTYFRKLARRRGADAIERARLNRLQRRRPSGSTILDENFPK